MASDMSRAAELVWRGNNTSAVRALEGIYRTSNETTKGLKVDADEQTAAFAKVREETGALKSSFGGLLGLVGIGGVAFGLRDLKDSGVNLQRQQVQLQSVLRATGQAAGDTAGKLGEYAEKLSTQGGFGTTENLAALTQYTGVTRSATQAQSLLTLSTNIARQRGLDLTTVQQAVARAYAGSTRGLQQLLGPLVTSTAATVNLTVAHQKQIATLQDQAVMMGKIGGVWLRQQEINDHITAQQADLAALDNKRATGMQVLAAAQREFGGATSAYAKTSAGQISNLDNALHNLVEQLGVALLPTIDKLVAVGATFVEFLARNKSVVLALTLGVAGLAAAWGAMKVLKGVETMVLDLGKAFGIVQVEGEESALGLTIAWDAFMTATIVGIVIVGLIELIEHWKQVEAVAVGVWHAIEGGAVAAWNGIEHAIGAAVNWIWEKLKWLGREAVKIWQATPLGGLVGFATNLGEGHVGSALGDLAHGASLGLVPSNIFSSTHVTNPAGQQAPGGGSFTIHNQQPIKVNIDGREVFRAVVHQALNAAARGPTSLVGGSIQTGAPGLPVGT